MRRPGLILLAAGGSTRMGEAKQLLPWGNTSLLRHACAVALAVRCSPVVVVLGCEAEACRAQLSGLAVVSVINNAWKKGLGSSIAVGVQTLQIEAPECSGALILLADQPTVTPALLEALISRWSPPECSIAATAYDQGGGVPAIFDRSCFPDLLRLEHDRGAKALIARDGNCVTLVQPETILIDLDTPEAYREHRINEIASGSGFPDDHLSKGKC